jgi:hypothetical protein
MGKRRKLSDQETATVRLLKTFQADLDEDNQAVQTIMRKFGEVKMIFVPHNILSNKGFI